ncbi:MAG TPA: carboxypeptidase-like regulatory domain-containing protein [Terriglobales bacterium]|nr:carboxypeptidase-like regulatory domain-containing protein [Terriglobales bacterium]
MSKTITCGLFLCLLLGMAGNAWSQDSYQVISVTDGGSITGTVKWAGPEPHLTRLAITKDPEICDPESAKTRDLERLIIGPQGGVANTVVYLRNVSRGKAFDLPQQRRFLDQKHCRYEPHILLVPQNALLEMKSSDATLHTIHMDGAASYNLPFPFPNQIISRSMQSPGVVNLKCNGGHVWMNAEMFVAPHPYYAVTDESGKFEITNIPPGDYVLVAWHEGWSVERQEAMFDVLTEKRVLRPVFNDPKVQEKNVSVKPNDTETVNFVITEK